MFISHSFFLIVISSAIALIECSILDWVFPKARVEEINWTPEISMKRDGRIAIVGGGPAGVHFASSLLKLGFTNIELFEATERIGGKSFTHVDEEGVPHEMGTCYMHSLYGPIRDLLREFDPENAEIFIGRNFEKNFRNIYGSDLRNGNDSNVVRGEDFMQWVLEESEEKTIAPGCWDFCPNWFQQGFILTAITKYRLVYGKIFGGKTQYGMPPIPRRKEDLVEIANMTAMEFLAKYDLLALEGILRYGQQAQGYGILETIPAFYFLWWTHPDFLENMIVAAVKDEPAVAMLSKGFSSLWQGIADKIKHKVKISMGARVISINRGFDLDMPGGSLVYEQMGEMKRVEFDYLVMAVNLDQFAGLIKDQSEEEKELLTGFDSSVLCTTLFESEAFSEGERPIELWLGRMREGNGRVYYYRNSALTLYGKESAGQMMVVSGRQRRVAYQYLDRPLDKVGDASFLMKQFKRDLSLSSVSDPRIIMQKPFPYMIRYNRESIVGLKPWRLRQIQGKKGTFWIGSSVSFESVLDVVTYNNDLIKRINIS